MNLQLETENQSNALTSEPEQTAQAASAPVGVIDMGSNSIRLLVFEGANRNLVPLYNEKVLCGLGRFLGSTGKLSDEGMERALAALNRFRAIAAQCGVSKLYPFATAAVRDAKNAGDFVASAEAACGETFQILSGQEEAEFAALGVIAGFDHVDGIVGDLGGGSLEFVDVKSMKVSKGTTTPLGGLRLIDTSGGNLKKAAAIIDEELGNIGWLNRGKDRPFYAIGGTWRAFAKLHMAQFNYPLKVIHGYTLSKKEALNFAELLQRQSPSSLEGIQVISRARRETVPFGALILERIFKTISPSRLVFSAHGVREGLIYSLLPSKQQSADPLISSCEVLAIRSRTSLVFAQELLEWTDPLFANAKGQTDPQERRIRHAICLLSELAWRVHPEHRASFALNWILSAIIHGIDHKKRTLIALAIFYRYGGPKKSQAEPEVLQLVDEKTHEKARILGAAIRLAHAVSSGVKGVLPNTPIKIKDKRLLLDLSPPYHILNGEVLDKRIDALASFFENE